MYKYNRSIAKAGESKYTFSSNYSDNYSKVGKEKRLNLSLKRANYLPGNALVTFVALSGGLGGPVTEAAAAA